MDEKTLSRLKARARVIKSIAHPTRLFIAEQLLEKEYCVCELTEMIGADVSTVSRHLSVLRNADVVQDVRKGNKIYYHLKARCILNFVDCVESVLEESLAEQASQIGKKVR